jgi:pimeloyl-ACP methyl ester carboxylesterase
MRKLLFFLGMPLALWLGFSVLAGIMLPDDLLKVRGPQRSEAQRERVREVLKPQGARWTSHSVKGGENVPFEFWWLHRPESKGVAIIMHGFGDDAWGTAPRLRDLPDWDAVVFTFRGRDKDPRVFSTLGAWERWDLVAVVHALESMGVPRQKMVLVGVSQSAGASLLALKELESEGAPLAGALLESPWKDFRDAARNHVRGPLGAFEPLSRLAQCVAISLAARRGHFKADEVSPLLASQKLRTPIALLAGDADEITPLEGVRAIAKHHPDLTVVPGATHCEASGKLKGGWQSWANPRMARWRL